MQIEMDSIISDFCDFSHELLSWLCGNSIEALTAINDMCQVRSVGSMGGSILYPVPVGFHFLANLQKRTYEQHGVARTHGRVNVLYLSPKVNGLFLKNF